MKRRESRWLKAVAVTVVRPLIAAVTKPTWRGQEHIPREGGVIIAANHLSVADPLTVAHFLYVAGRRWPTFTAKEGVFRIPIVGPAVRKLGQIPVHRGTTDAAKALHEAEEALTQHGAAVIFYPEGTCTRDPNLWPMVAKTGVARLALRTGAPVIPVAHWGEQHLLPYGTAKLRLFPRTPVEVVAGPPVDLSRYREQPLTATTLREATAEIMTAITRLQAEIRGEEPPLEPYDPKKARGQNLGPNNSEGAK
ncbi:lysophospholipid acyltransferase family protein [Thermobifida fusca]|jgi:1-acyl-sn-glycerol-3-phosphate acyltransferase|uniref:Phospholipid/glycerol acyltransferase n=1 Tax=Thermobifida fusca (strain YX) TaxID=269800 RepID=Q47S99_THEFY|nr:lysophospholipid acyltransferase family protein [Thermobifida fusca]AAZ54668.1 phospholipid/glycerol acyltransferase [Thermobifida fusca YX]MDD6792204.1 lysophospholipid acyltransferase family protein [Thermobifida fusca]PZN60972.1 MAG: 1-acyl-sn-glycerol-3-phosphate acyltransferase [Thermobifida fusca]QOS60196.1 1-acyl-sn-glycerol-3-phosphate acyltransferase [Thermobifida fusca]